MNSDNSEKQFIPVPEEYLTKIRSAQSDFIQFKAQAESQLQLKEAALRIAILETFLEMGLAKKDSIDLATGMAEIK